LYVLYRCTCLSLALSLSLTVSIQKKKCLSVCYSRLGFLICHFSSPWCSSRSLSLALSCSLARSLSRARSLAHSLSRSRLPLVFAYRSLSDTDALSIVYMHAHARACPHTRSQCMCRTPNGMHPSFTEIIEHARGGGGAGEEEGQGLFNTNKHSGRGEC